ncbi:hypothetical protein [Octadecabacter antarcticus]|nr:hypothetical protein [Octadecabacter antarcticus]
MGTQATGLHDKHIFECIEVFYNLKRRRSGIGYQKPQKAFDDIARKAAE